MEADYSGVLPVAVVVQFVAYVPIIYVGTQLHEWGTASTESACNGGSLLAIAAAHLTGLQPAVALPLVLAAVWAWGVAFIVTAVGCHVTHVSPSTHQVRLNQHILSTRQQGSGAVK